MISKYHDTQFSITAGLKKLPVQTIINLCMVLGFLANGYATGEFEVTAERLGVYLPVCTFSLFIAELGPRH